MRCSSNVYRNVAYINITFLFSINKYLFALYLNKNLRIYVNFFHVFSGRNSKFILTELHPIYILKIYIQKCV